LILGIHHVAILTHDIEEALAHYCEFLGCDHPKIVDVYDPEQKVSLKTAMLKIGPTGNTALQIIQPIEGIGCGELEKGGEGTIFEIGYQIDDLEEFNNQMTSKGFGPVNIAEKPISGKFILSKFGNRYSLLPREATRGTRSEFVQIMKKNES
jgi:catechol 2,3-dioxygenase-like lactoylglutathione lyase family enzyme